MATSSTPKPGQVTTNRPRRIEIQRNQPTQSQTTGQLVDNWVTVAQAWTVTWVTGIGTFAHVDNIARASDLAKIRIRYRRDITISPLVNRIVWEGRAYGIVACIDVNAQHQYFELTIQAMA